MSRYFSSLTKIRASTGGVTTTSRRVHRRYWVSPRRASRRHAPGDFDYESGGGGYARLRRPDPQIAALIRKELGSARTVINVGAGAGSYEPEDCYVVAVEPSAAMRAQRPPSRPPAIDATAEELPFDANSFDAGMAALTVHHWRDPAAGLAELRRVTRGPVVILTFDPTALAGLWLAEYFPEVIAVEQRRFLPVARIAQMLGGAVTTTAVPIKFDCLDGFGEAYYGRPEALLQPRVRHAMSGFGLADRAAVDKGVERLARDLHTGEWDRRFGELRLLGERVGAVRLVVAR
jgi:SAM-dependent methyltransferase